MMNSVPMVGTPHPLERGARAAPADPPLPRGSLPMVSILLLFMPVGADSAMQAGREARCYRIMVPIFPSRSDTQRESNPAKEMSVGKRRDLHLQAANPGDA